MTVRLAVETDFAAVAALRLAAYRAAPEFTIADETAVTRWNGRVLMAKETGQGIIATMQAIECDAATQLQKHSDSPPPPTFF